MLAEELKWMLARGFTMQYRQPSADSRPSMTLYESPISRSRTFPQRDQNQQDLWGGGRDAELGAWNEEEEGTRAMGRRNAHRKASRSAAKGIRAVE